MLLQPSLTIRPAKAIQSRRFPGVAVHEIPLSLRRLHTFLQLFLSLSPYLNFSAIRLVTLTGIC